ncbi:hypothetical protein SB2_06715 [Methylobacterium radiotolerans]|nr:hypothetical protein SB3_08760 [Methylobacterium radiotolerans]KTS49246.1 hypothetical protein SB2_06715 [Methylobacterium radiotolerans]
MTQTPVNVGASPNDRTGDDFRDAFIKLNNNDADLDGRVTLLSRLLSNTNPSYATVTISGYTIKGVGTAAGLVAAGNDARIVGALQAANNLSDVASPSTARANLGLGSLALQSASGAAITGGTIDGTPIGSTTPAAVTGTTITGTSFVGPIVRTDVAQNLSLTQKIQAKRNVGVGCIGRRYYIGQPVTLSQADIGGLVYCEANVGTLTVPLAASFTDGDTFWIYSRGVLTVQATAGDPYTFGFADANRASFVMQPGDRCQIILGQDAWDVLSYSTAHGQALLADRAQSFTAAQKAQLQANLGSAAVTTPPEGQCRLTYTNSTTLTLIPWNGNQLWINGAFQTIPSSGVTVSNSGLSAGTLYYMYASWTGSAISLIFNTSAYATDPLYGIRVFGAGSSDAANRAYTYVGMIYTDSGSPGVFADAPGKRWVSSWFNPVRKALLGAAGGYSTTSSSVVELSTGARASFLTHAAQSVEAGISGQGGGGSSSVGYGMFCRVSLNNDDAAPYGFGGQAAYGNCTIASAYAWAAPEGLNFVTIRGQSQASGTTTTFNGAVAGSVLG